MGFIIHDDSINYAKSKPQLFSQHDGIQQTILCPEEWTPAKPDKAQPLEKPECAFIILPDTCMNPPHAPRGELFQALHRQPPANLLPAESRIQVQVQVSRVRRQGYASLKQAP